MTLAEQVFKDGFAPVLGPDKLAALRLACVTDDQRLQQGRTCFPWDLAHNEALPCESACPVGFAALSDGATVGDVGTFFAETCFAADQKLGEVAGCRFFLDFVDDTPRAEMLTTLAGWVDDVLAAQAAGRAA